MSTMKESYLPMEQKLPLARYGLIAFVAIAFTSLAIVMGLVSAKAIDDGQATSDEYMLLCLSGIFLMTSGRIFYTLFCELRSDIARNVKTQASKTEQPLAAAEPTLPEAASIWSVTGRIITLVIPPVVYGLAVQSGERSGDAFMVAVTALACLIVPLGTFYLSPRDGRQILKKTATFVSTVFCVFWTGFAALQAAGGIDFGMTSPDEIGVACAGIFAGAAVLSASVITFRSLFAKSS